MIHDQLRQTVRWLFCLVPPALMAAACGGDIGAGAVATQSEPIVNGTNVTSETEGVVYVTTPSQTCTGQFMTNSWVLTAAHCVVGQSPSSITVFHEAPIGTMNKNYVVMTFPHPSIDVVLLQLTQPANVFGGTSTLNNVLALQDPSYFVGKTATCYGYGLNTTTGGINGVGTGYGTLRKADFVVSASNYGLVTIPPNSSGQTLYYGDSGGPCFYYENGYRYQIGVIDRAVDLNNPTNGTYLIDATSIRDWADYYLTTEDQSLGGYFNSAGAIASWGPNRLDVLGLGGDNAMWESQWNGSTWSSWQSLGGSFTSDPSAGQSLTSESVTVFARGPSHDFQAKQSFVTTWNTSSSSWTSYGGKLTTNPAVVNSNDGRLWVFGRGTDNALWYRVANGNSWSGWQSLGGSVNSDPAAASMSTGVVHVFYLASNNTLAYMWYDPGSGTWSGQQGVDSTRLTGAPAVASSAGSRLDVFVRNSDGTISYRKWYGLWAPTWNNLGYSQTSNVAVASWGTGRMDIVFRGANNDMRHFAFGG